MTLSVNRPSSTGAKVPSTTTGKTSITTMGHSTTGTKPFCPVELATFKGQDVEVTYRATHGHPRVVIGKLVGVAQRDRTGNPPDAVLANRSRHLVLINTTKITKVRSTMEINNMWEMDPMKLAQVCYEAFIDRAGVQALEWTELAHSEREIWMAASEAVRDAVSLGA